MCKIPENLKSMDTISIDVYIYEGGKVHDYLHVLNTYYYYFDIIGDN